MTLNLNRVAAIILAGGEGKRLFPLTATRSKPAVYFGGRFRFIDIPISNSIHSGVRKIFVLTQYLSYSLHRHIIRTYHWLDAFPGNCIDILTPEMRAMGRSWYDGTADAVRQNIEYLKECPVDYFCVLSGDQLYSLDFRKMLEFAVEKDADCVIASLPVTKRDAKRMGVMKIDDGRTVVDFSEKPKENARLDELRSVEQIVRHLGSDYSDKHYLASMGIYLFKRQVLFDLLEKCEGVDFGQHLLPQQIQKGKVFTYLYGGYWEDVGTIESYYQANLALTDPQPRFDCYNENWFIFSASCNLPGPKVASTNVHRAILCEGAVIDAKEIRHSIVGQQAVIGNGTVIEDAIIFGNDAYSSPESGEGRRRYIGSNCHIKRAILDKNVHIGNDVILTNETDVADFDYEGIHIRDGIIVLQRGAVIPSGFNLNKVIAQPHRAADKAYVS